MELIKDTINQYQGQKGYLKWNSVVHRFQVNGEELNVDEVKEEVDLLSTKVVRDLNFPFVQLEISKIVHDFKNLLNPLYGMLQNNEFAIDSDLRELGQYYKKDFLKIISEYEDTRKDFYDQEINLLTILDLYLKNFIVIDNSNLPFSDWNFNLGHLSRKINNLNIENKPDFLVVVQLNLEKEIQINKIRLSE